MAKHNQQTSGPPDWTVIGCYSNCAACELEAAVKAADAESTEIMKRLAAQIDRLNLENRALKALLWRARDAVTDHDFQKGHRYDILSDEIEQAVAPGDRCRLCGVPVSRQTDHVCAFLRKAE